MSLTTLERRVARLEAPREQDDPDVRTLTDEELEILIGTPHGTGDDAIDVRLLTDEELDALIDGRRPRRSGLRREL